MNWEIPSDRNEFVKIESINKYLKKAKAPSRWSKLRDIKPIKDCAAVRVYVDAIEEY